MVKNKIIEIFSRIGFNVSEGPGNGGRLAQLHRIEPSRIPSARDMGHLFIQTNPDILLRTHTSSVQVRYGNP